MTKPGRKPQFCSHFGEHSSFPLKALGQTAPINLPATVFLTEDGLAGITYKLTTYAMRVPPGPKPYGLGSAISAEYAQAINYTATITYDMVDVNK